MFPKRFFWSVASATTILGFAVGAAAVAFAQSTPRSTGPQSHSADAPDGTSLAGEIRELRAQVRRLEDALRRSCTQAGMSSGMSGTGGGMMGMDKMEMGTSAGGGGGMMDMMKMGGMSGSGMTDDDSMGGGASGGMTDDMEMMGMMGMGSMAGSSAMKMQAASALPGFPGASHVYHIGATGFFLDHAEHITLGTDQQTKLNGIKRKALLEKATAQRKIDEAEQQLWELTGADEPDIEQIQAKVEEIEDLRGKQRVVFIRAIGEAAQVLTDEQRKALLGTAEPSPHASDPHQSTK